MDPPSSTLPVSSQTPRPTAPLGAKPPPSSSGRNVSFSTPTATIKIGGQSVTSSSTAKKRKQDTSGPAAVVVDTSLDDELLDAAEGRQEPKPKRTKPNPAAAPAATPAGSGTPKITFPKIKINAGVSGGGSTPSSSRTSNTPSAPVPRVSQSAATPRPTAKAAVDSASPAAHAQAVEPEPSVNTDVPYRPARAKALMKVLSTTGVGPGEIHAVSYSTLRCVRHAD
jgi:predicted component of type VI protein secretion system